jgi:hypothetical protein
MGTPLTGFVFASIARIPAPPVKVYIIDVLQENVFIATGI